MDCRNVIPLLDDYLDGRLETAGQHSVREHLQGCPPCRRRLEQAMALQAALRTLPAPAPPPGFAEQALARAARAGAASRAWRQPGAGLALAASLVIGIAVGLFLNLRPAEAPVQVVHMKAEQPETVRLMFTSAEPLAGVTLSLTLPDNVELVGYAGRRELTWQTDLRAGGNLLQLPLIAHGPASGELVARLDHGASRKTFRVNIEVQPAGGARLPAAEATT